MISLTQKEYESITEIQKVVESNYKKICATLKKELISRQIDNHHLLYPDKFKNLIEGEMESFFNFLGTKDTAICEERGNRLFLQD
jgi:hypothetical protein